MCILSRIYNIDNPSLLSYFFIFNSARFIYGSDRLIDGSTTDSKESLLLSYISLSSILYYRNLTVYSPLEVLILLTYSSIKRNLSIMKPLYIGILWSICCIYMPSIIDERETSISNFISLSMLSASVSNIADIDDIEEDTKYSIDTIPVRFGINKSKVISYGLGLGAVYVKYHSKLNSYNTRKIEKRCI